MHPIVTFFALFFATCGTCWSAGPSEPEDKALRLAKKHSTKLKEIRKSDITVQCSACVQHKGQLPCNFRDGALSIGPIDFSEIIPQNPELTLDEFLGLAQPKLKEQGLICDALEVCLDWATAGPIPANLSSSYITKLVVDSDFKTLASLSANLPKLNVLSLWVFSDVDPDERHSWTLYLSPIWKQKLKAPDSCRIVVENLASIPYFLASWALEPSESRFPCFTYAGDALAWDELKKRGEKIGYGENIEPYRGFLHNNQDVPPNQNWMAPYRTVIQSNFSRASGPLAILSLGAFRQLPTKIIQEVCYHLSFKEKIALIKALPGLEYLIRDTMKYDSPQTTYRIPREPKNNQYRPGLTEESIIFELSSGHPRAAHKGQRYHIEAEVDASFWQNFCGGVSAEFCYINMWDVVQRTFIGENGPEEVWERTGDEPLFVCGPVEVSYLLSQKPLGHHSTNKDPLSGLDFDLDHGEYNFRTDLCDVAWHQFFRQLDPACKEPLVHHSYHFDYQLLQNKVFLLLLNSEIKTLSDQTKECVCGISALGGQVNFSVNVSEFYEVGYVRTLENSEYDDLTVHVEKKIPGEPFQAFDIELCVRLFDLSSFHNFFTSLKKIGADILSGMGVSNVPVGVYQDRLKADKFFETGLTLKMKEKRSRFNPVSVKVQNVILQHCQMPQFLCFEGVDSLEIKDTTEKFDLSALYNIYWENGSKKGRRIVKLPNTVIKPKCFQSPCFETRLSHFSLVEPAERWSMVSEEQRQGTRFKCPSRSSWSEQAVVHQERIVSLFAQGADAAHLVPYTPAFDSMMEAMKGNVVVKIEPCVLKFKSFDAQASLLIAAMQAKVGDNPNKRCCVIEDSDEEVTYLSLSEDRGATYGLPYLRMFLGLPVLVDDRNESSSSRTPRTFAQLQEIYDGVQEVSFNVFWQTPQGEELAHFGPLSLLDVKRVFSAFERSVYKNDQDWQVFGHGLLVDVLREVFSVQQNEASFHAQEFSLSSRHRASQPSSSLEGGSSSSTDTPSAYADLSYPEPFELSSNTIDTDFE